jgi:class 3 adenylate cyclase/tetratricopeptide (TPR) repeat protein
MAKNRGERHGTATEFVESLTRALKIKPSESPTALQSMTQTLSVDQLSAHRKQKGAADAGSDTPSDQQRQMTAVSVDVKGLAEILYEKGADAERVRSTMDALWSKLNEVAKEHGGATHSRAEETGLILWGRDRTREDDCENAIRATLAMRDKMLAETRKASGSEWEPTEENPLPFSAGITTGPVLLEREPDSGSYTASGAPITLAGRLKDAAPPGGILVAHETFTLVRGVFTFTQGEPLRVRGRKEPIEVYVVTQVKPRAFRLRALGIEGVETKMIGREIELRLLQEAMTLTLEDGETQVVTVVGEAGVGKSRLLFEFRTWTDLQEQTVWLFQARATQPSMLQPYSLARDLFSFRFQILDSDPISVVHEKFVTGVEQFLGKGSARRAHFIGQLVGFDFSSLPDVEAALKDGDAFRRVAQGYLGELFATASHENPVVLYIEDIHWADDRSLDLINNLVRDNANLPLFVLCMARPSLYERRPQWGEGQRFHERIQLEPLSQLSSRRLVRELLKHVPEVPTALRDLVVDRADGNPFYIEELIKALIDDRVILKGSETWSIDTTRLSSVRVPATLTGVLQARLDTLPPPLYQLLQRASVAGRIFWDAAAIHLSREAGGLKPTEVQAMLEDLRNREMILQREESSFAGTVEYVFRHAILRDVTYETVIPRQRRALHKLVGDWLLEIGGERAGEHTLLVAEHYSRAEEASLAAAQLAKAGERATLLATYEEASTLLQRAHEILTGPEHTVQRLGVEMLRANLESIRGRYPKALEILKPALEEARTTGDLPLLASVLGQLGRVSMWLADEVAAVKYIGEALELSRKVGDKEAMIFNLRQMGNVLVQTKPSESRKYHEESVQLARQVGNNNGVAHGLNSLAIAFQLEGNSDKAMATFLESLQLNRECGDRLNEAMVLGNLAGMYSAAGDLETAERSARESMAIAKEIGAVSLLPTSQGAMADICLRRGRDTEALRWIRTTGETIRSMGLPMSLVTLLYGIHKIRSGDRARGLAWVGFARAHDPNKMEIAALIRSFRPLIRGEASEEEVEAALRAGEGLKLEEILAEAEREG